MRLARRRETHEISAGVENHRMIAERLMLGDISRSGVEQAVAEFDRLGRDAFLDKYGYGQARGYFLLYGGKRYGSKAICGAAHGFDRPAEGPLRPGDFSGGNATVARLLRRLGFDVVQPSSSRSGWAREERLLALDVYLRCGVIGRTHPEVISLSEELNRRQFHRDAGTRENFRNPNGVALKLANYASLDPTYAGTGMSRHSAGDEETWETYAGDTDLLAAAVAAIRTYQPIPSPAVVAAASVDPDLPSDRERHHDIYEVPARLDPLYAERREAELVERFARWLRGQGATVAAHHYEVVRPVLRNDLADETARRLWEAKADVSRSSVRMALGQLLDYLRFEPPGWSGGVLMPFAPADDPLDLIRSSGRAAAWPTSPTTFKIKELPRTSGLV